MAKANAKVAIQIIGFVAKVQNETYVYFSEHYPNLIPPIIILEEGSKYFKLNKVDSQTSVYCFVDKQNGDIYKAASWKIPATHVRGNIFDENYSWGKGVNLYGGTYLR